MIRSSQKRSTRAPLALTLLVGILLYSASACARTTTVSQAEPDTTPQEDTVTAATLTSNEIQKRPQEPIESLLQSRASGVRVAVNPDGSLSLRIRGPSSFYLSNEPLIVVDGTPLTPGWGGNLSGINPHDIESIRVLKDPVDTSMYGVRGSNGVIVVTTMRPMR